MYFFIPFKKGTLPFEWRGIEIEKYQQKELEGITKQILVNKQNEDSQFEVRYYHFEKGSIGDYSRHDREYFFYILHGKGKLKINKEFINLKPNDVIYLSPNELIQIVPQSKESFGFLCITSS